jgi:hypothetical protein
MSALDKVQVIGDELHFDGELVAIMTTNAAPTHRDRFLDALDPEGVKAADEVEDVPAKIEAEAKKLAKGGLLRMTDLAIIIARLKEDT